MGNLAIMVPTPAELDNLVTQGTAWVTVTGSSRSFPLKNRGAPIELAYPKEGAIALAVVLDVIKNAPHPNAAQALVNHLLSDDSQAILAKEGFGPLNKNVKLAADLAGDVPYGLERMNSLVSLDRGKMNAKLDEWNELWAREIEAK